MGWSGGNDIFDSVALELVLNRDINDDAKRRILGELIDKLTDADWDTCDESLERFKDYHIIVELFAERGFHLQADDDDPSTDNVAEQYAQVAELIVTFPWWDYGLDSMMGLKSEEWAQALARRIVDGLIVIGSFSE